MGGTDLLQVLLELPLQFLHAGELRRIADALQKSDFQDPTIKIAGIPEQVNLDLALVLAEGRVRPDVDRGGTWPGRSSSIGGGSKVSMTAGTCADRARSTRRSAMLRCPRWTPSKFPMATKPPR